MEQIHAAQPDLRFHVETILGDGDLVAVVGSVGRAPRPNPGVSRLIWLIRLEGSQLAEMWMLLASVGVKPMTDAPREPV